MRSWWSRAGLTPTTRGMLTAVGMEQKQQRRGRITSGNPQPRPRNVRCVMASDGWKDSAEPEEQFAISVTEPANPRLTIQCGEQKINLHGPEEWQDPAFTLRGHVARPGCGDLCFVWDGTPETLKGMLDRAGAKIVEGPVARQGGRKAPASSVYVRDPDGNLLEFMIYS